jgi:hypothetical protein
VADSTLADTLFHTERGRPVISGRGITPDVEVKLERQSWLALELWRANLFANFVDDRTAVETLAATTGHDLLGDFRSYLEEKEFKYQPRGSLQLDELKKILDEEEVGDDGGKALEALRAALGDNLPQQFKAHEDELARLLDLELINRSSGQNARAREALKQDQVYQKALDVLAGKGEYRRALGLKDK